MRVDVDRKELLTIVKRNRKNHRAIFEEAVEGYRIEAVRQLEKHIKRIKQGSLKYVSVHLPVPEDHTPDYDRIIGLVEMSVPDFIPLTDDEYRWYVLDDWAWKRAWLGSNSAYSATAAAMVNLNTDEY